MKRRSSYPKTGAPPPVTETTAIEARIKQIKKQYFKGDPKKYLAQLESQGLTDATQSDDSSGDESDGDFDQAAADAFARRREASAAPWAA